MRGKDFRNSLIKAIFITDLVLIITVIAAKERSFPTSEICLKTRKLLKFLMH